MDGTGRLFEPLVPFVSERFDVRVVTYPRDTARYDELEEEVGRPPPGAVLVGESFGGPLALRVAARHTVAAVVIVASFICPPRRLSPPSWLLAAMHPPPALAIRMAMLERASPASLVTAVRSAIAATPASTLARRLAEVARVDATRDLAGAHHAIHWLVATRDRLVPRSATALARAARGDLLVEEIDGPHLLAQTRPADVARAIERAEAATR